MAKIELTHEEIEMINLRLKDAKDEKITKALSDFLVELCCSSYIAPGYFRKKGYLFNEYAKLFLDINLDEINWDFWCEIKEKIDSADVKGMPLGKSAKVNALFLTFLVKNNLYKHPQGDKLKYFLDTCNTLSNPKFFRDKLFRKNIIFDNCFIFDYGSEKKNFNGLKLVDTNANNPFLVDLLKDFLNSDMYYKTPETAQFAEGFIESYADLSNFDDISNFNYKTFEKQFDFYKNRKTELIFLVRFYIYLYVSSGYTNLFKNTDPIDITCLQRQSFIQEFKKGFRLVKYNPFEEYYPEHDKWIISPNDFEKETTQLKPSSYFLVDFTTVKNDFYRPLVKKWFWHSTNTLPSRKGQFGNIKDFIEFVINHKTNSIKQGEEDINLEEINIVEVFSYRNFIIGSYYSSGTINNKFSSVIDFLRYCEKEQLLSMQNGWNEFLSSVPKSKPKGGESIPESDLLKIENYLRERAGNSVLDSLYHALFHVAIDTEFRINQILSLKKDDVKEGLKSDQFFIFTINKTSGGQKEMQAISSYTKRHLDIAIKHTQELRDKASDKYKDFIFLNLANSCTAKEARPISLTGFRGYLKRICTELGIKEYTPANLRDTHMTRAVEFSIKKGLSPLETSSLTGHIDPKTTNKHYVDAKVKTFAEATYGVIIGDIDIKGNIITNSDKEFKKEDTVDDGCGFCNENKCKILTELGCLLCDGFVVTLDRIPFFEHKIKEIDLLIEKETITHEREHLASRKKLYVAYLVRLYTLKEELSEKGE